MARLRRKKVPSHRRAVRSGPRVAGIRETIAQRPKLPAVAPGSPPLLPRTKAPDVPHAHIVCRACGRISQVTLPPKELLLLRNLSDRRPTGWDVDGVTYTLTGSCQRCREGPTA